MATFKWTDRLKKAAHETLLANANNYEVKRRKYLKGIVYLSDGRAKWVGQAHDYTVDLSAERT